MSCFICQAFGKNSPSNPQLAQECLATPLSRLPSINSRSPALLLFFLTFFSPLPPPCFISPPAPAFLPVCSSFQACQSGSGEKSLRMPNLTKCSLHTQRVAVEMGSDLPKLDLLTVSLTRFYYSFSLSGPVVLPSVAFSTLPYRESHFPSKPIRCLLCKTLMTDLLE